MSDPLVSILIVNWNTRDLIVRCLDSLPPGIGETSCEVIVVDNGSVDGSAETIEERDDIRLIRNPGNLDYAAAVNRHTESPRASARHNSPHGRQPHRA